jgi:hypothetical protein
VKLDARRTSAAAAGAILIAGYLALVRPLESAAGDRYADLDAARAALERSVAMAQRIPALEAERSALGADLARIHAGERRAATIERFLHNVADIGARDAVTVQSIFGSTLPSATPAPRAATPPPLDEIPLDLALRGRYGDVIRAVRDLNAGDVAAGMTLASLGNADRRGAAPQLTAAFHVLLLREPDASK